MDEIAAYLIEEIAMDGESGTSKERFASFIRQFYEEQSVTQPELPKCTVDDDYVDGIWKCISKLPHIHIGRRLPAADSSDGKSLSKQAKGIKKLKADFDNLIDKVEILSKDRRESFQDLYKEEYGDQVRIVLDEDLVRFKIAGTTNEKFVSGATYATLQIAARERENGVSSVEIGRLTGYDAKTVFSFIKKLIELELVKKFKVNENRASTNFILHRRYWGRSPRWLAAEQAEYDLLGTAPEGDGLLDEGNRELDGTDDEGQSRNEISMMDEPMQLPFNGEELLSESDDDIDTGTGTSKVTGVLPSSELQGMLSFPRLSRTQSAAIACSSTLLRNRLLKLMEKCKSHVAARPKLWDRLGLETATKKERKIFNDVIRRMIHNEEVEPVSVDIEGHQSLRCIRLTDKGLQEARNEGAAAQTAASRRREMHLQDQLRKSAYAYQANVTFERQIVDIIHSTGASGATVNDIASRLHLSAEAKRHIDEYLRKSDEVGAAVNAPDLSIEGAKEMFGRERRIRFWTRPGIIQHYRKEAEGSEIFREQITKLEDVDLTKLTSFCTPNDERTWSSVSELLQELSNPLDQRTSSMASTSNAASSKSQKMKAVKLRKSEPKQRKVDTKPHNPVDPATGRPRKGRPRKSDQAADKRKAHEEADKGPPKKRGRPRKDASQAAQPLSTAATRESANPSIDDGVPPHTISGPELSAGDETTHQPDSRDEVMAELERNQVVSPAHDVHKDGGLAHESEPAIQEDSSTVPPAEPVAPSPTSHSGTQVAETLIEAPNTSRSITQNIVHIKGEPKAFAAAPSTPRRTKTVHTRSRLNVSAERRAQIMLEFLDAQGGILDELYFVPAFESFMKEREGDNTSAFLQELGDLREVKTRRRVYDSLTSRDLIGIKTTMAPMKRGGGYTQRKVVYKTGMAAEAVDQMLHDIVEGKRTRQTNQHSARTTSGVKIDLVDMDAAQAEALAADQALVTKPLDELLDDPATPALFSQSRVITSQKYGLIVGSMAKLVVLHKYIMQHFDAHTDVSHASIVSAHDGVVDIEQVINQIPLETFLKLKGPQSACPELDEAIADTVTRCAPVSQQSAAVRASLEVGPEGKSRRYFQPLFTSLYLLGLGLPVVLDEAEKDRAAFSAIRDPTPSHSLYRFKHNSIAITALEQSEPLPMQTLADAEAYWSLLRLRKTDVSHYLSRLLEQPDHEDVYPKWTKPALERLAYHTGKSSSWNAGYQLSKKQSDFLLRFVKYPEEARPGSIVEHPELLAKLSFITMAPLRVIEQKIQKAASLTRNVEFPRKHRKSVRQQTNGEEEIGGLEQGIATPSSARRRNSRQSRPQEELPSSVEENEEQRAHKRAANLRKTRATEWLTSFRQVCQTHNIEGARKLKLQDATDELRGQYLNTGDRMMIEMLSAIVADVLRPPPPAPQNDSASIDLPEIEDVEEPETDQAVAQRGSPPAFVAKRKRNKQVWSREADELLRDAGVILTVRDNLRSNSRSNWKPIKALFPDKSLGQIRKRYFDSLAQAVGEEAYLGQLAKEWQKLWELYRGTPILPDRDPRKADAFDLLTHVEFLRQHIDKEEVLQTVERAATTASLTMDIEDFEGHWIVRESRAPPLISVHDPDIAVTNTGRADTLYAHSLALQNLSSLDHGRDLTQQKCKALLSGRAECVVKMLIDTPSTMWNEAAAVDFVLGVGQRQVEEACKKMLKERCIRLVSSEGRRLPGRNFTYTDDFAKRRHTVPVPVADLARESLVAQKTLISRLEAEGEVEVLEDDEVGETIAIVQLLSKGLVEPDIDLEQLRFLRDERMFNCKALIDQDLEFDVKLRKVATETTDGVLGQASDLKTSLAVTSPPLPHRASPADWLPLTQEARNGRESAFKSLAEAEGQKNADEQLANSIMSFKKALDAAGKAGIPTSHIELDLSTVRMIIESSSGGSPMAFLAGYDCPRVISGLYLEDWAVKLALKEEWIMPRSWFAMEGQFLEERWREGIEQLLGHLFVHCGATRARLAQLLSPQWDRQEVCDLIRAACSTGVVEQRFISPSTGKISVHSDAEWLATSDEDLFVAPTDKPWFGFVLQDDI